MSKRETPVEWLRGTPRSKLRYALFAVKGGTATEEHKKVWESYEKLIGGWGLDLDGFPAKWDLQKEDPLNVVSGHIVYLYRVDEETLFNDEGQLKE